MRKLFLLGGFLSCVSLCSLLAACVKKKDEAPDAGAATARASAVAEAPVTKGAGEVTRFPTETKIDNEAAKTTVATLVRQSPRGGSILATIKAGTDATKIAEHQDCFLITFPDPKDANTKLTGWVGREAFNPPPPLVARDAGPAGLRDGQAPHRIDRARGVE